MNESVRQLFLRFPELWGICPTFGIQEEPLTAKLTVFKNAFVFGIDCWALSSGNAAIRPPSMSSTMLRPYLFNHRFQCSKQPVSEYDEALYCGGPNSLNHYHFIYDALPWIISCHDIQPVVNCRLGKAQIDILRTFNIKPNVVSNPNVTKVQTLTVPCNKFWSLNDRLQFLRGLLSIGNIPFKPSKLYIKRSASRRSILNASALETALNSKGFSSINPEGRLLALKIAIGLCLLKPSKDVFTGIWHGLNGVYGPHPQDPIIQQD